MLLPWQRDGATCVPAVIRAGADGSGAADRTRSERVSPCVVLQVAPVHPFPTADVPDHAHYTIGSVILAIGVTGVMGNLLVIYAFCR